GGVEQAHPGDVHRGDGEATDDQRHRDDGQPEEEHGQLAPVLAQPAAKGAHRASYRGTGETCVAETGTSSGTAPRTASGSRGSGTDTVARVVTDPPGDRHGDALQEMRSRPLPSKSWSAKAMSAAAWERASAWPSTVAVTKARPASRAAWVTA